MWSPADGVVMVSGYLEKLPWLTPFGWLTILISFMVGIFLGLVGGVYVLMSIAAQIKAS